MFTLALKQAVKEGCIPFNPADQIDKEDYKTRGYDPADMDFKKRLMYFEYYNCTNTETGRYSAF